MNRPIKWTYERVKEITKEFQGETLSSLKKKHGYSGLVNFVRKNGYTPDEFGLVNRKIQEDQQHRGKYSNSSEWSSYKNMRLRCYDSNHRSYRWYGAKGIKVCDRWMETPYGFLNMISDLGEKPNQSYQIDRIDEDKDYSPENCMWSTHLEQQHRRDKKRKYPNCRKPLKHNIQPNDRYGKYIVIKELESIRRRKFLCREEHTEKTVQVRIDRLLESRGKTN